MSEPEIAEKKPVVMTLDAGTYYWCSCGKSAGQPFCDGAHKGTGMAPLEFSINEKKEVAVCLCKKTGTPPFCDGTHKSL